MLEIDAAKSPEALAEKPEECIVDVEYCDCCCVNDNAKNGRLLSSLVFVKVPQMDPHGGWQKALVPFRKNSTKAHALWKLTRTAKNHSLPLTNTKILKRILRGKLRQKAKNICVIYFHNSPFLSNNGNFIRNLYFKISVKWNVYYYFSIFDFANGKNKISHILIHDIFPFYEWNNINKVFLFNKL